MAINNALIYAARCYVHNDESMGQRNILRAFAKERNLEGYDLDFVVATVLAEAYRDLHLRISELTQ